MLTTDIVRKALPSSMKNRVSQDFVDSINDAITDPNTAEMMRDNILGYASVLANGRYKLDDYINAVKYVSFKAMGKLNIQAFIATFPDRYAKYKAEGISDKDIATYVSAYNKNKLVNLIYEQSLVPSHILNADVFQRAINIQAEIMGDPDVSPKVRSDAANSLLTHLKRPESQKIELDVAVKDDSVIRELKDITMGLAVQQKKLLEGGAYSVKEISNQGLIIEGEVGADA
jgi:hypothetical protein